LSSPSFEPPAEVPQDITFVTLPKALFQFHHLPPHVPIRVGRQEEFRQRGYDFQEGFLVMQELLQAAPGVPGAYLYQLFVKKWPQLREVGPYFESGRIAEAIPKLVEVLDIDPECPLTCFQLGYCFRVTGELEKSESFYRKALRMAPDAGWIYSNLGRTYQAMGNRARAAEAFWAALELLPGDRFVLERLVELGELFLIPQEGEGGDPAAAFVRKEDYERKFGEAARKEKDPENLLKFGWKLLRDRLLELSVWCFQRALELEPAKREALLGLGTAQLEAGRFQEAERSLNEYLETRPESAAAHLNLFKTYLAQEETDLAWDEIQTAVRLEPDRLDALRQLFSFFKETGRGEEGMEALEELSREHPTSPGPPLALAQARCDGGDWEGAERAFRETLSRSPHDEGALLLYTSEMGKRGLREELIRLLEAEPPPLSFPLTVNLALAYSQAGRMEKSRQTLRDYLARKELPRLEAERAQALLRELEKPL
jgi:tetratricopeptide (TPR) repeat protein